MFKTILREDEKEQFRPVPCELKPGEAVFHHPLAVHGSYPNRWEISTLRQPLPWRSVSLVGVFL